MHLLKAILYGAFSLLFLTNPFSANAQSSLSEQEREELRTTLRDKLAACREAEENDDTQALVSGLLALADFYYDNKLYEESAGYLNQSLGYVGSSGNIQDLLEVQNRLAICLFKAGRFDEALDRFGEVEEMAFGLGDFDVFVGNAERKADLFSKEEYFGDALDAYLDLSENVKGIDEYSEIFYSSKIEAIGIFNSIGRYSDAFRLTEELDRTKIKSTQAIEEKYLVEKIKMLHAVNKSDLGLRLGKSVVDGQVNQYPYLNKAIAEILYKNGMVRDATKYIQASIQGFNTANNYEELAEAYDLKSKMMNAINNYEASLSSVEQRNSLEDVLLQNELVRQRRELELRDLFSNVENTFQQDYLKNKIEIKEAEEMRLLRETDKLNAENAELEKQRALKEAELIKETAALNETKLANTELERRRLEQEAFARQAEYRALQQERENELLAMARARDSVANMNIEIQRQKEISDLKIQEEASQQKAEQSAIIAQNRQRLSLLLGFGLLVALGSFMYARRLNNKLSAQNELIEKQKSEVELERERSENLLLNILPVSIADELKLNGSATPLKYDSATVLFTDFIGFTKISSVLEPEEIIAELNDCFSEFDKIAAKHRLEKIKTIGDSYMCAGGIPDANATHAIDAVNAASEILRFMNDRNESHQRLGKTTWPIRVGVHTGALVAGVVGKAKFAYDIWGDTVNVASRMEQGADPNSINMSEATYQQVKDHFNCTFRGEVNVKNKGQMGMYRVEV